MSNRENDIYLLVKTIESLVDKRYEYLREREYENYILCSKINKEYNEIVKELVDLLEKRSIL